MSANGKPSKGAVMKFFDDAGNEVPAEQATRAVALLFDNEGQVIESTTFYAVQPAPDRKP